MNKQLALRLTGLFLGTALMALGIELIVLANCGSDSVSTLILGLLQHSDLAFGRWSQLISGSLILLALVLDRKILGFGSIVNALLLGQLILFFDGLLVSYFSSSENLLLSFMGFVVMAFGTAIYLFADLGSGPMEAVMLILNNKFAFSLKKSRIILDFIFVAVGFLLGGPLGLGTIFAVFLLGPLIEVFLKFLKGEKKIFPALKKF